MSGTALAAGVFSVFRDVRRTAEPAASALPLVPSAAGDNPVNLRQRPQYKRTAHGVCLLLSLQERRTALISAAVTGQIDVRGLADAEDV